MSKKRVTFDADSHGENSDDGFGRHIRRVGSDFDIAFKEASIDQDGY